MTPYIFLQPPLLEPLQDDRRRLRFFACPHRFITLRIPILERTRPVMPQVRVVKMHNHVIPAMPSNLLASIAKIRRLVSSDFESIPLGPVIHPSHKVRGVSIAPCINAASIRDRGVGKAVELHDRDRLPAGLAKRSLLISIEVEGTGYWGKGRDALCGVGITC
jgi:hypothetical protein